MFQEIYEAFVEAGASVETAGEAATVLANSDARFNSIDSRFNGIDLRLEQIRSEQIVIRWIAAFNLAFTLAIPWKIFT